MDQISSLRRIISEDRVMMSNIVLQNVLSYLTFIASILHP